MKSIRIHLRKVATIAICLAVTMTACGQGSRQNADTEQVKVQMPQDAFKRFGYYVPQPELDTPYGVRIRLANPRAQ